MLTNKSEKLILILHFHKSNRLFGKTTNKSFYHNFPNLLLEKSKIFICQEEFFLVLIIGSLVKVKIKGNIFGENISS